MAKSNRKRASDQSIQGVGEKGFSCPDRVKFQCRERFEILSDASFHTILEHKSYPYHRTKDRGFQCPFEEEGCIVTFAGVATVTKHIKSKHVGRRIPCPFRTKGCDFTFTTAQGTQQHIERIHKRERHPCPCAVPERCTKIFSSSCSAAEHARRSHEGLRCPCPYSEETGCPKTFAGPSGARAHGISSHTDRRFPCIEAKTYNCDKTFARQSDAISHAVHHFGARVPCPWAAEYGCKSMFVSDKTGVRHSKFHTHPILCPRHRCFQRFVSMADAYTHADDPDHPSDVFFLCPLPMCKNAVSGKQLSKGGMEEHRQAHIRLGDMDSSSEYEPIVVQELRVRSSCSLYLEILLNDGVDIQGQVEAPVNDQDADQSVIDGDIETDSFDIEDDEGYQIVLEDFQREPAEYVQVAETLSESQRERILAHNTAFWRSNKEVKVFFSGLSLTCLGPSSGFGHFVSEKCPNGVVIDFDTSRLSVCRQKSGMYLKLRNRCVSCQTVIGLTRLLAHSGVILGTGTKVCLFQDCYRTSFRGSGKCIDHLFDRELCDRLYTSFRKTKEINFKACQTALSVAVQSSWNFPQDYAIARKYTTDIQNSERPGSDLLVLDCEFSPASYQLWEFALIEQVSGKVLVDARIHHQDNLDHGLLGDNPFLKDMSQTKAKRVYSRSRSTEVLTVNEVAAKLVDIGVTQDSIFLVWHTGRTDLRLLRSLLESEGHTGIIPGDNKCVPLIYLFRKNLQAPPSGLKSFPLALEVLFPLFFPRHKLIGLNHRAREDCLQTRLMILAFDHLCKPITQRGIEWNPEIVTSLCQSSLSPWVENIGPCGVQKTERTKICGTAAEEGHAGRSKESHLGVGDKSVSVGKTTNRLIQTSLFDWYGNANPADTEKGRPRQ